jgi:hypothetical protein
MMGYYATYYTLYDNALCYQRAVLFSHQVGAPKLGQERRNPRISMVLAAGPHPHLLFSSNTMQHSCDRSTRRDTPAQTWLKVR